VIQNPASSERVPPLPGANMEGGENGVYDARGDGVSPEDVGGHRRGSSQLAAATLLDLTYVTERIIALSFPTAGCTDSSYR
jgi:hypothetical protein